MTTWTTLLVLLALTCGALGAPIFHCPKQCSCTGRENSVKLQCKSSDFLKKSLLSPEQINEIVSLNINDGPATKTNPDLSHLHNLKRLSLTSMKIQQIAAAHLPKSLEYLDLAKNSIMQLPQELHLLPALKELNLFGNPISCNCDSLVVRDALLEKRVSVTKPVKCESPENLRGKMWLSVTCKNENIENLFGEMQGDAPYEGSGSGDIALITDPEPTEKSDQWDTIEEEYIPVKASSNIEAAPPSEPTTEAPELEEGSGDEPEVTTIAIVLPETSEVVPTTVAADYEEDTDEEDLEDLYTDSPPVTEAPAVTVNMSLLEQSRVKACNFNCSTPSPLPVANETDVSPPPDFFEGLRMVAGDLGLIDQSEKTTTTTTTTTTTAPETEPPEIPPIVSEKPENNENKTLSETEVFENDLKTGKDKENIEEPKQSHSTFIFLSVLLLIIICLVIYAIVKKRSLKRNNRQIPQRPEEKEKMLEELELFKKIDPENDKPNGTHEAIPLMNGHNENQNKNDEEGMIPDANGVPKPADDEVEDDDVDLRPKMDEQKNLLTPEAKRVTIKASEIPNSTPKTPILVTRHVNSDGSIITTPTVDQNV